jgi:excisionase family DNA binding protein
MKRINIFLVVFVVVFITFNAFLLNMLNIRVGRMDSKLNQLEVQIGRARNSVNYLNNEQSSPVLKEKEVFTPTELALYLEISMGKIYDMIDAPGADLPYVCIDGEYRFGKEAIDEWLKTNKNINTGN